MVNELFYSIALSKVNGIGPVNGKALVSYCGSAEKAFKYPFGKLVKIPGIGESYAHSIKSFKTFSLVEQELKFIEDNHIHAIPFYDNDYPYRLKQLPDSPLVIFTKGDKHFLNHNRVIAVVGTRTPTREGLHFTENLIEHLKEQNVVVVSGLAFGIDIAAHKACLKYGAPTFAVVAHGLDKIYPREHLSYAKKIVESNGAIVTEHLSNTEMRPDLFPRRNRIVAGLADAVLVVESRINGGSMITADIAHSYNKEILAVPGRSNDPLSAGCNYLIKNLKASMCEGAEDLLKVMNWDLERLAPQPRQLDLFQNLSSVEKEVVGSIQLQTKVVDEISMDTHIPLDKLSVLLLDLEMRGLVKQLPGKTFGAVA